MISWLAALAAVLLAAAATFASSALASSAHGAAGDVRIEYHSPFPFVANPAAAASQLGPGGQLNAVRVSWMVQAAAAR